MTFARRATAYFLLLPALIPIGAIILYPMINVMYLSFFKYDLLEGMTKSFIMFRNYRDLLIAPFFINSVLVTFYYTVGCVALSFAIGLIMALLLNAEFRFRAIIRLVVLISYALPWMVSVLIWYNLLSPQVGAINEILVRLGILKAKLAWFYTARLAMPAVIVVTSWKYFPMPTLLILAGLKAIPEERYEASSIDGANGLQQFLFITMPGLQTVNFITITVLSIWTLKLFVPVFSLTNGGPGRATQTMALLTYEIAFEYHNIGFASAIATVMVFMSSVLVVLYLRLIRHRER